MATKKNANRWNLKLVEAELSESEALSEVERATTKKGNPKQPRNLKGRKKNVKGRGKANGKSKKKACGVEAEGDLLVAELTSELSSIELLPTTI